MLPKIDEHANALTTERQCREVRARAKHGLHAREERLDLPLGKGCKLMLEAKAKWR